MIKLKARLCKEFHIAPSEIDGMYYWEFEMFMQELSDMVEAQNKDQQAQTEKYHINDMMKNIQNPSRLTQIKQPQMPKIPALPK